MEESLIQPLISIVIPTFNSGHTINICIESIINQTYKNIEVLIIDGGSTDQTINILNLIIKENDFIKVYSEKDNGIYDAMNKGIRLSGGEWLYFIGSDDKFYDGKVLERFVNATHKYNSKFFYGNVLVNGNTSWARDQQIYDGCFDISKLLTKNICHQAILYNRVLFKKFGDFNLKYVVCADFDMNLRIASKYSMKHLDFITAVFNPGGASSNINDHAFMTDLPTNIIRYFHGQLYKQSFRKHEHQIIWQAKYGGYSLLSKMYLLGIGYYFKLQRKLEFNCLRKV